MPMAPKKPSMQADYHPDVETRNVAACIPLQQYDSQYPLFFPGIQRVIGDSLS